MSEESLAGLKIMRWSASSCFSPIAIPAKFQGPPAELMEVIANGGIFDVGEPLFLSDRIADGKERQRLHPFLLANGVKSRGFHFNHAAA